MSTKTIRATIYNKRIYMNKIKDNYEVGDIITPSIINEAFSVINQLIDNAEEMTAAVAALESQIEALTETVGALSAKVDELNSTVEELSENALTKDEFNTILSDAADAYFPVQ